MKENNPIQSNERKSDNTSEVTYRKRKKNENVSIPRGQKNREQNCTKKN